MARTLNVLASVERRQGRFENAVRHAQRSVNLGRGLRNDRHLGQALNTLASALIDSARTVADFEAAEAALSESRKILARRRDMRGLDMLSTTQGRLEERLAPLGRLPGQAPGIDL